MIQTKLWIYHSNDVTQTLYMYDASSFSTNTYYTHTLNAWRANVKLKPNSFRRVNYIIVKVSCKDFKLK